MRSHVPPASGRSQRNWLPRLVLLSGILLTVLVTTYIQAAAKTKDRLQFDTSALQVQRKIQDRLSTYMALLNAGRGLFAANSTIDREQFRAFVERLRLNERYPGIQGIGFSARMPAAQRDATLATFRQRGSAVTIRPNFPRDEYHAIVYLEPLDMRNRAAIGFDMFTESTRRDAMERARDTGVPAASGRVQLVQEIEVKKQAGFLIYEPIYRGGSTPAALEERRATLQGFIYSPFRADDFIHGIFGNSHDSYVDFRIYDSSTLTPDRLLHQSVNATQSTNSAYRPQFQSTTQLDVAGQPWTIAFTSRPELYLHSEQRFVPFIALAGIGISLMLYRVTQLQVRARLAAEQAASELRRSESALRQSEERLQLALDVGKAGVWDWDIVNNRVHWSDRIYQFHGVKADAFEGTLEAFSALIHPDDQDAMNQALQKSLQGHPHQIEFRVLHPNGTVRWLSTNGGVIYDGRGTPVRMLGATIDITERKIAEEDRSRLLAAEQAARAEAESANRMKDEFLAILSHELRSPLNAILGWLTLLRTRQFDKATIDRALETVERNARAQAQLVEDLLDVSRIIRGQLRLQVRPVNLIPVIEAAIDTVRPAADAKMISITTDFQPIAGVVSGDSDRLQQIIWNLLSNAIKFTPDGGKVQVQLHSVKSQAAIVVSDSGKGISPEFLPYVFERFRQADSSVTRSYGGLGLGLAIVRHLVELHGGTIHAHSDGEDQGASFTVRLPLASIGVENPPAAKPAQQDSEAQEIAQSSSLQGLQILVVDDEADARELLVYLLQGYGAIVRPVASASAAIAVLVDRDADFHPDILISDIGMPDQDGHALMREVRTLEPRQGGRIPALALSAYARSADRKASFMAGFQAHLTKPVKADELIETIAVLTGRSGNTRPL